MARVLIPAPALASMPTRLRRRSALVVGWALALVLAGCSAQDTVPPEEMPLEREFAEIYELRGDSDSADGSELRVQNLIASCMKQEGFDYTPAVPPDTERAFAQAEAMVNEEEFARQYGYGVTTGSETPMQQAADELIDEWVDPNEAMIEAMGEEERDAYWRALNGSPDDFEPREGCDSQARQQMDTQSAALEAVDADPRYTEMTQEMGLIWLRALEEPRVLVADRNWHDCMADAGYPGLENPADAQNSIMELAYSDVGGFMSPRDLTPASSTTSRTWRSRQRRPTISARTRWGTATSTGERLPTSSSGSSTSTAMTSMPTRTR